MGDLTKNISRRELACHCGCRFDSMDVETISVVQEVCDRFAAVLDVDRVILTVLSAARCSNHNLAVSGAENSQHPKARAMDIQIDGVTPVKIYRYLDMTYPGRYGLGLYPTFVHIDTRSNGPARW